MKKTRCIKVLTLYVTRNSETFNIRNYKSVRFQRGVCQDIYIVSAEPVDGLNNIVISPPKGYQVPIRVSISLNKALAYLVRNGTRLIDYDYIFKVDGDALLPVDYLENLLRKQPLLGGSGQAMVISTRFFMGALKGLYPIKYSDDGFVFSRGIALGIWPEEYKGLGPGVIVPRNEENIRKRGFIYGIEYYKWGTPLQFLLVWIVVSLLKRFMAFNRRNNQNDKGISNWIWNLSGFIYAAINGVEKYRWSIYYKKYRVYHFLRKIRNYLT
ncbi:MAG: hypothetical protein F7B60_06615 [Desulfurococcales archaeon]|nr:hypothetical protein [Desulfurococcales archaeon]